MGGSCAQCEQLLLRVLRSCLALFDESVVDLAEGSETSLSFSLSSPTRSTAPFQGSEACSAVSSPGESQALRLLSSEEVDVMSVETEETVD